MDQYNYEKKLSILYPLIGFFSLVACITSAIAWNHWKFVLDVCVETNCGCILNGFTTLTYFTGGHVAYCHWATYGPLLSILFCIIFGLYHVFRVCMGTGKSRTGTTTVKQRSGDVIVMTTRSEMTNNDVSPYYWIPASVVACFMFVYTLVHAAMLTDGFLTTCKQYRTEIIKYVRASGNMVKAIQGRISCAAVFDFMDYLHEDISYERRREDRINTAATLVIALITSWICVVLWIAVAIINIKQSRASRSVRL